MRTRAGYRPGLCTGSQPLRTFRLAELDASVLGPLGDRRLRDHRHATTPGDELLDHGEHRRHRPASVMEHEQHIPDPHPMIVPRPPSLGCRPSLDQEIRRIVWLE